MPSIPKYSLHQSLFRSRSDRKPNGEDPAYSTPLLHSSREASRHKFSSLPTPPLSPSPSAPSVVFPTKVAPASPTSFRKRALALRMGCRSRSLNYEEDEPPEPKHLNRCPTLNMLKNIKRPGSPSPRSPPPRPTSPGPPSPETNQLTASSRASSPVQISRPPSSEVSRTAVSDPLPPVLTLPNEGSMNIGLGWTDEFGIMADPFTAPPRPWSRTFSESSQGTSWSQPSRSPSPLSTREYPTSSTGFFSSNNAPSAMPNPTTVLEAAASVPVTSSSPAEPAAFRGEAPVVRFREHCDGSSPPPRLGFPLRHSSEDWATAVLRAVGGPAESFA